MAGGFIKLHRKMTEWGWYSDQNTKAVFLHLLLNANFEEHEYRGVKISPGQLITGRKKLAEDLGLSERQIRTALEHLKSTNEIAIKTTNKFSVVTIVNWAKYQLADSESTNETTNTESGKRPTTDHIQEGEEYINTIKDSISGTEAPRRSQMQIVMDAWNELPLANVKTISNGSNRAKMLQARIKQHGLEGILEAIGNVSKSKFLLGQNKSGWTATFDWFIKPNNFIKVYEGNYTDKLPSGETSSFSMSDDEFKRLVEEHSGADEW